MATITANGVELNHEITGSGPPVVLVHGSWNDLTAWMLLSPLLAERFTVVTYDRRGHGESSGPPAEGTRSDDEDDLAALIEVLGIAPANVAGNSFGASIALSAASRYPETIRSVTGHEPPLLAHANDDAVESEQREGIARAVEIIESGDAEAGARFFVDEVALGPGSWAQLPDFVHHGFIRYAPTWVGETRDPKWDTIDLDALAAYPGRMLLTQGPASPAWFARVIDGIADRVTSVERTEIAESGHVPHMTHPDALAEALVGFFAD